MQSQEIIDWAPFVITCYQLFWTFVLLFILCYAGEEVSATFEDVADEIYQCEWDSFPYQIRRILPIVMIVAQDPVQIKGYGGIPCSLDRYKKVES